jgi:hypothetical protein
MAAGPAIEHEQPSPSQCWCCGSIEEPGRLVDLGNHPEVAVCTRGAHSLSRWAWEVEGQGRTGLAVRARKTVVRHGWHDNKLAERGLRWLGRFTL